MESGEVVLRLERERSRQARCGAIRSGGKQCRSFASGAGEFCFAHDRLRESQTPVMGPPRQPCSTGRAPTRDRCAECERYVPASRIAGRPPRNVQ